MNIKSTLRRKLRSFLGITDLEQKILNPRHDITKHLELRARDTTAAFIELHMLSAQVVDSSRAILDFALSKVDSLSDGLFLEFGVYQGVTINHIAPQINTKIYGFDSFEGLPTNWRSGYPKGAFSLDALPKCAPNVELVVGWFEDTLPVFVESHPGPVTFLHVDCDLYSSTQTIFKYLGDRLAPGAIIVFNEYFNYPGWQQHEHLALCEYLESSGRSVQYLSYNRFHEQVAVEMI